MEIREIFDTIESDPNMDIQLQTDIIEKIKSIAKADKMVDGLEEKIAEHKDELSEKELKYIINKCISYKSVFYRFRNGGIVDYDQLNEITKRIFDLEKSINNNDFTTWKNELLAYKGSKQDKEEDKMLKNMLMVVPEEKNAFEKATRMFKRAMWKLQQKAQAAKEARAKKNEVIELPQNSANIDIELNFDKEEKTEEQQVEDITPQEVVPEVENNEDIKKEE